MSELALADMAKNYDSDIARLNTTVKHLDSQLDKTDKRFSEINSRLDSVQQQIANLPRPTPAWVFAAAISLLVAFTGGTIYYGMQFSGRIASLEARPVTQASALLNEAVSASKQGSLQNAAADIDNAAAQVQIARFERLKPSAAFFQQVVTQTSNVLGGFEKSGNASEPLRASARQLMEQLAAYRTELNEAPDVEIQHSKAPQGGLTCLIGVDNSFEGRFDHILFNLTGHPGVEAMCSHTEKLSDNIVLSDSKVLGGRQRLDIGVHFKNVVFIGTRILYNGGEVDLDNVAFVNCTFDIPAQPRGFLLAQYAVLNQKSLALPPA